MIGRDWTDQAKCKTGGNGSDHMFFADTRKTNRDAKDFCTGRTDNQPCPVQLQCLQYALQTDSRDGVWGGLDPLDRAPMHEPIQTILAHEDLPSRILGRMKDLGISYREAATRSGGRITAGHISNIANQAFTGRITETTLTGLAAALELPMDELTA